MVDLCNSTFVLTMNIKCCICHELFVPSDDVYFTPCGHFFHFPCVSHWLERSKTCPQCRTKVTERSIHRAYFNLSSIEDTEVDTTMLTSKIDSLNFQLLLKDKDLKICGEDNASLKKQAAGLRAEVRKLEVEIEKHRSAIFAFKEQVKFLKELSSDSNAAKQEVVRLKKNLQEYRNVQTLISDSQDEIDRMLSETQDRTALVTYVSVMKREMESNVHRRKELRERIKKLEKENVRIKSKCDNLMQQEARCRQMEEDLTHCENEKKSLWKKLEEIESQLRSRSKTTSEDIHRFIAESPAPERSRSSKENDIVNLSLDSTPSDTLPGSKSEFKSPEASSVTEFRIKSPYLSVKNQGAGFSALSKQSSRSRPASSSLSILSKKPRLMPSLKGDDESKEMHYDGFGGHSKVDDYPSPIIRLKPKVLKNNLISVKVKRRKLPDGSNKKLDSYFVDLT